jgi:hypothetical protein
VQERKERQNAAEIKETEEFKGRCTFNDFGLAYESSVQCASKPNS